MTLSLISIGLADEKDMSLRALEEARACDALYAELYTMKLSTTLAELIELINKPVTLLLRGDLEERSSRIVEEAKSRSVGLLVGGDCLSATTHISLVLEARQKAVKTRVIHGSSIFTAVAETGLSIYKFGRTVTMPFPEKGPADAVLRGIEENLSNGLHTLVLLDLDNENYIYMASHHSVQNLMDAGLSPDTLVVAIARLGQPGSIIRAGKAKEVASLDLGEPPQSLVVPGSLHFLEEDALKALAGCPPEVLEGRTVKPELDRLIEKYTSGCKRVREEMKLKNLPARLTEAKVIELLDHADRYITDADYYKADKKSTALTSIAYAEGVLDALRLLGVADFEW